MSRIVTVLLVAAGAALMLYPAVASMVNDVNYRNVVSSYEEHADSLSDEERAQMMEVARTYNENLAGDPVHDPFIEGSGFALPDNYASVLDVDGSGLMATISIPSTGLRLPIYHGVDAGTLERGAGHMPQTSLPIGGFSTHAVLTGHTALPGKRLFDDVHRLQEGDLFIIDVLGERHAYAVERIQAVEPDDVSGVRIEEGRDLVTLLTCTPYGVNTHRLLVTGAACPMPETVEERHMPWSALFAAIAGAAACVLGIAWAARVRRRAKRELGLAGKGERWRFGEGR